MVGTNPIVKFCLSNDAEIPFISAMEDTLVIVSCLFSVLIIDLFEYPLF